MLRNVVFFKRKTYTNKCCFFKRKTGHIKFSIVSSSKPQWMAYKHLPLTHRKKCWSSYFAARTKPTFVLSYGMKDNITMNTTKYEYITFDSVLPWSHWLKKLTQYLTCRVFFYFLFLSIGSNESDSQGMMSQWLGGRHAKKNLGKIWKICRTVQIMSILESR